VVEAVVKPEVAAVVSEKPTSQPVSNGAANVDLSDYLKRVADNPRDLSANLGLGNVYYERQDYGQALNYFATSLKVADKDTIGDIVNKLQNIATVQDMNPRFHRVLGDAYMKQGHYHWALSEYSKALEKGGTKK
jgi:tetratricopeptide (TPR) repeat protein